MFEKNFDVRKKYTSKYKLMVDMNIVWVKFRNLPNDYEGDWEQNLYHFCLDIRNVPELIKGIMHVFYGDYGTMTLYNIKEYNDDISIDCNYEMVSPRQLGMFNHRTDIGFEDQYVEFNFNYDEIPTHPIEARVPTPAMVWVTDTLKKIYDDWKENDGTIV
jgi:hypothetical protein